MSSSFKLVPPNAGETTANQRPYFSCPTARASWLRSVHQVMSSMLSIAIGTAVSNWSATDSWMMTP